MTGMGSAGVSDAQDRHHHHGGSPRNAGVIRHSTKGVRIGLRRPRVTAAEAPSDVKMTLIHGSASRTSYCPERRDWCVTSVCYYPFSRCVSVELTPRSAVAGIRMPGHHPLWSRSRIRATSRGGRAPGLRIPKKEVLCHPEILRANHTLCSPIFLPVEDGARHSWRRAHLSSPIVD